MHIISGDFNHTELKTVLPKFYQHVPNSPLEMRRHWTRFTLLLYTHDCTHIHSSNTIIKFADDTTVVGLITGRNNSSNGMRWSGDDNLVLNTTEIQSNYDNEQQVKN